MNEIPNGLIIDHIDGNPSNNVKNNLRLSTSSQNQYNSKIRTNNKSGYKNICKGSGKVGFDSWMVYIGYNKNHYTKLFPYTDEGLKQAILHRDEKLQELHGEFVNLGIPP